MALAAACALFVMNGDDAAGSQVPACVVDNRGRLTLPPSSERCAIGGDRRFETSVAIGLEPTLEPTTFSLENDLDGDGQTSGVGESLTSESVMPNYTELSLQFHDRRASVKDSYIVLETCRSRRGDLSTGLVLHVTRSGSEGTLTSTLWHDANDDGIRSDGETIAALRTPYSGERRVFRTSACAGVSKLF